jgi:hypothetical protein
MITEPGRPARGKSRITLLWEQGHLLDVEEELEALLDPDGVERSTMDGMLQSGSHPSVIINKIRADRR